MTQPHHYTKADDDLIRRHPQTLHNRRFDVVQLVEVLAGVIV